MTQYKVDHSVKGTVFCAEENGHKMRFDWDAYRKVYEESRRIRRDVIYNYEIINNHPLVLCTVQREDGKVGTAQRVTRQWYMGYYEMALCVDANGSHFTIITKNISCRAPGIVEEKFKII